MANQIKNRYKPFYAFFIIGLIVSFFTTSLQIPQAHAGELNEMTLPKPGMMVHLSPQFNPALLKGMVIDPKNAFKFDFIIDKGDKFLAANQKKQEYTRLIKYFLASLAVPDEDQWVNLSPYEKNRIIKADFGKTAMGRDLLAQDYLLKQITASLIYPQDKLGQKFWDEVYSRAYKEFGTTNIPVNTFNKVWIIPDEADIYEKGNVAYLYNSHLRVMLEEDYLSLQEHHAIINGAHSISSQLIRSIILPQLEKEVNQDANFAPLRQVYSGMILAAWYKRALRESLLAKIYANKDKLRGVDQDPRNNEAIYQQYLKAYKKGVFNFIKEDVDKYTNESLPRKYFSGGTALIPPDAAMGNDGLRVAKFLHVNSSGAYDQARSSFENISSRLDYAVTTVDPAMTSKQNIVAVLSPILSLFYGFEATRYPVASRGFLSMSTFFVAFLVLSILVHKMKIDENKPAKSYQAKSNPETMMDKDWDYIRSKAVFTSRGEWLGCHIELPRESVFDHDDLGWANTMIALITKLNELGGHFDIEVNGVTAYGLRDSVHEIRKNPKAYQGQGSLLVTTQVLSEASIKKQFGIVNQAMKSGDSMLVASGVMILAAILGLILPQQQLSIYSASMAGLLLTVAAIISVLNARNEMKLPGFKEGPDKYNEWRRMMDEMYPEGKKIHSIETIGQNTKHDSAMNNIQNINQLGGIDMNAANLHLNIKRDGQGVPLPVSQQDLASIHIDGLVPVILEIKPANPAFILSP